MSRKIGSRELKGLLRLRDHAPAPTGILVTNDDGSAVQNKPKKQNTVKALHIADHEQSGDDGEEGGYEGDANQGGGNEGGEVDVDNDEDNEEGEEAEQYTTRRKKQNLSASVSKPITYRGRVTKVPRGRGRPPKNAVRTVKQPTLPSRVEEKLQPRTEADDDNDEFDFDPWAFQKDVDEGEAVKHIILNKPILKDLRDANRAMELGSGHTEEDEGDDDFGGVGDHREPTRTHAIIYSDEEFQRRPAASNEKTEDSENVDDSEEGSEYENDEKFLTEGISQIMQQKPATNAMTHPTVKGDDDKLVGKKAGRIRSEELPVEKVGKMKINISPIKEEKGDVQSSKIVRGTAAEMKTKRKKLHDEKASEDGGGLDRYEEEKDEAVVPAPKKKRGGPPKAKA